MTTTTFPAHMHQILHTIADQQAQTHTIELSNEVLLLDNLIATMSINGAELHLVTEAGITCVTAQAFWHAFAGAEPTASEAGLLLADSLLRWQALQHMQQLQVIFQHIFEKGQAIGSVPLPSYHLSHHVMQALDAYDGTAETTRVLARILKQDVSTIDTWALSIGKFSYPIETAASHENDHLVVPHHPSSPFQEQKSTSQTVETPPSRLRWSAQMDEQLTEAFEASQAGNIKETVLEIAERFQWPANAVQGRVYTLKLNETKRTLARHDREPATSQEGD